MKAMHRMRVISLLLITVLMVVSCSGCWSRVEIENMSFISVIGVDRDGNDLLVSFQIINPKALAKDGAGGEPSVFVFSVKEKNISNALAKFSRESPRVVRFKQLDAIVLGESIGKEGVSHIMDFFARNSEMRRSIWVMVAKGSAQEVLLKGIPAQESVPGMAIRMLMERQDRLAPTRYPVKLGDFLNGMSLEGTDAIASAISVKPMQEKKLDESDEKKDKNNQNTEAIEEKKELAFEGAGVFRGDKLVGYLGPHEVRGVLWVLGKVSGGIYTVPTPSQGILGLLATDWSSVKIKPVIANGNIKFQINIYDEGYVYCVEKSGLAVGKPETLTMLEREKEKAVKRDVEAAVRRSRELHSDFLQLGDRLYREHPEVWEKVKGDWRDTWLPRVVVDVKVTSKLERTGLIDEPLPIREP